MQYVRLGVVAAVMGALLAPSLRAPAPSQSRADASAFAPAAGEIAPGDELAGDTPVRPRDVPVPRIALPTGAVPLGSLRIPAIGLDTPFFSGVHAEVLEQGPGHWPGTAVPGTDGNAVLSGHRTTFTAPFNGLDRLQPGDEVVVAAGPSDVVYRVFETQIVAASRYVEVVTAQAGPGERVLTMFACHPKGSAAQRIVVRARAVDG